MRDPFEGLPETMSLNTEVGAKVRFTGLGGYDGERRHACSILKVGHEYEVLGMSVGQSTSTVTITEGRFNTVLFENVGAVPDIMPDDGRLSFISKRDPLIAEAQQARKGMAE